MRHAMGLLLITLLAACAALSGAPPLPPAPLPVSGTAENDRRRASFAARCAGPGVVRCVSFDDLAELRDQSFAAVGERQGRAPAGLILSSAPGPKPEQDCAVAATGCSLRFTIPSRSGPGAPGSWYVNFSDDLAIRFGAGETFHVQWRQRFSRSFLKTRFDGDGWKQIIVGEGDAPGYAPDGKVRWSCTQLELVVTNAKLRGFPQMYHSCGAKDEMYEPLTGWAARSYEPDEWMTFQIRVHVGRWYRNDRNYHRDSQVALWVARDGGRSELAVLAPDYDLANTEPGAEYGKLWLLPYHTGKNPAQEHPVGHTWYDELIVSREPVADP